MRRLSVAGFGILPGRRRGPEADQVLGKVSQAGAMDPEAKGKTFKGLGVPASFPKIVPKVPFEARRRLAGVSSGSGNAGLNLGDPMMSLLPVL